jgi:CheY-like chemotaxis protein
MLQYPYIDFDNETELKDGCGTLVNLIAGQYKKEMSLLGYKDLMMSPFESFINTAPDGIGIPKGLAEKYELSFEIEGTKSLVVELVSLDMLPKWKSNEKAVSKKILIVDDDATFTVAITPFLESQGFEVIVAHDGEEGVRKLKEKPDLVILDIQMPVMDGYEFVLEKKNIEGASQIPVIVMTAKDGMADMFKVEGAREYLLKPFQPTSLLKSIQRCI